MALTEDDRVQHFPLSIPDIPSQPQVALRASSHLGYMLRERPHFSGGLGGSRLPRSRSERLAPREAAVPRYPGITSFTKKYP